MALQLLLETSVEVTGLKSTQSESIFDGQGITTVLLPYSVVLINAETGVTLKSFDFPKKKTHKIIDCIYIEESRSLFIAFAGSSLATLPIDSPDTKSVEYISWPEQPINLFIVEKRGVMVVCEGSTVWHVTLQGGMIPPAAVTPNKESSSDVCMGACVNGQFISIIKKKKLNKNNSSGTNVCSVLTWNIPTMGEGTCKQLSNISAIITDLDLLENEKFISICSHINSKSLSIILSNSSNGRWLKYDYLDGSLLFERNFEVKMKNENENENIDTIINKDLMKKSEIVNAMTVNNLLWIVCRGYISVWDPRYGVELTVLALNTLIGDGLSLINSNGENTGSYQITVTVPGSEGSTTLLHSSLQVPLKISSGSLCNALGRLSSNEDNAVPLKTSKKTNKLIQESILNSLPKNIKENLEKIQKNIEKSYQEYVNFDTNLISNKKRNIDKVDANGDEGIDQFLVLKALKKSMNKFYFDIPQAAAQAFLGQFEALQTTGSESSPLESDWDMMKIMIHSGVVSLSKNKHLIYQASDAQRFDILTLIARYVPDLSERAAIRILRTSACAHEESLEHLFLDSDEGLQWSSEKIPFENTAKKNPKSAKKIEKK
mmetsp:Transcript_18097/g.17416  ORF Transcript_18097/g.17416 Transcript_18097/m.17416 type:complete len:603 (+) Transcript_18097:88-1896(+)